MIQQNCLPPIFVILLICFDLLTCSYPFKSSKLSCSLINQFEKINSKFRIYTHTKDSNSFEAETQLRLELTEISSLALIVYSRVKGDYEKNLKKILTQKIDRLYNNANVTLFEANNCLLYTSPSPRDLSTSRMPSSA